VILLVTSSDAGYIARNPNTRVVTRCNGLYYLTKDGSPVEKNKDAIKRYRAAHAIIFQSAFARLFIHSMLGPRDVPDKIILNGSGFKFQPWGLRVRNVLCSTDWRASKRPKVIADVARTMSIKHPKVKFVILGQWKGPVLSNMKVVGRVTSKEAETYCSQFTTFLDVGFQPCCSNTLVEAACSGMAVVASSSGGNPEIFPDSDLLYSERASGFSYMDSVPMPDVDEIVDRIVKSFSSPPGPRNDLSARKMVKRYDKFIEVVL